MVRPIVFVHAVAAALAGAGAADAQFTVFTDKAAFLAATGATDATGALPQTGFIGPLTPAPPGPTTTVGAVTFQAARYIFTDYSARLPGAELGISYGIDGVAHESFDMSVAGPVAAMGFDVVEPQSDPNVNAAFVDSTFTVTARRGTEAVHTFTFNAPNDTAAFVGLAGGVPFDRLEVRETVGGDGNEFFGRVYTAPVPEPAGLLLAAAAAVPAAWRRRRM